ncbi:peptide transporter [bacterium]|nr:peptide transporter [bacterium]
MARTDTHDKEIERYRTLLETPTEFKEGFGWTTVAGIFFCGLVMMPGGIYLSLMTGHSLSQAASWVTVILFGEVARRSLRQLSKQNLVILLHAASIIMAGHVLFPGGPLGWQVYRAYLVGSDAARDAGMLGAFPSWFAPAYDSPAITERDFLHPDWRLPLAIAFFVMIIGFVQRYTLGYFFFRLTSDVEKLPFPLAPIRAQGAMALAEADETIKADDTMERGLGQPGEKKKSKRWRIFSLGASIGIGFGMIQVGIPAITGLFLSKPFFLIPLPFVDTTVLTESILPATPTGLTIDIGVIFLGFVLPFWSVIGTFIAICLTAMLNPILHHVGILHTWQPGMDTVNTTFSNEIDFWLSFTIGAGLGIATVCVYATIRDMRAKMRDIKAKRARNEEAENLWATPEKSRGDYPLWIALAIYVFSAILMVSLCWILLPRTANVAFFLIFFAFFYSPFISYVNARLLGVSGQHVEIPHIKEAVYLLSGAKGIEIWLAPVPMYNFGEQAQSFRVNELTGVSFWSLVKTDLVALPILFVLSLTFWGFIWHSDPIPSEMFPNAQVQWELFAKRQVLLYSSTFVAPGDDPEDKSIMDSEFMKAIHPAVIGTGYFGTVILYGILSFFQLPIMLIYGMIRGFGQLPHLMILEVIGALLSRFYLQKKFGSQEFLRMAPTLLAGYFTGVGLIGMATIAMRLIKSAVSGAPF